MTANDMHLLDSVFLRDTPEDLFLYGTTDVIIGESYNVCLFVYICFVCFLISRPLLLRTTIELVLQLYLIVLS
jgi:hypothetical protein